MSEPVHCAADAGASGGNAGDVEAGIDVAGADACRADGPIITETNALVSDDSWLTFGTDMGEDAPDGWNTVTFDDRSWTASIAPNPAACGTTYEAAHSWERPNEPMWDAGNNIPPIFAKW